MLKLGRKFPTDVKCEQTKPDQEMFFHDSRIGSLALTL